MVYRRLVDLNLTQILREVDLAFANALDFLADVPDRRGTALGPPLIERVVRRFIRYQIAFIL